ncbi:hypothetical protein [Aquimarina rhabdastrellae]
MTEQINKEPWEELKEIWNNSTQGEQINIQFSKLIEELKQGTSQWEKDAIKKDMAILKPSLESFKSKVSSREKELINKDLKMFNKILKKCMRWFKKK